MMKNLSCYDEKLEEYVEAYLKYKIAIESEDNDLEATKAVNAYMKASKELGDYIEDEFGEEEPELPRIDVFFCGSEYHSFAYRIYKAIGGAKQLHESSRWRNHTMCYIGECLEKRFKGGK